MAGIGSLAIVPSLGTCYMTRLGLATWRSGYAPDCKSVYPGSIPGVASKVSPKQFEMFALRLQSRT